MTNIADAIAEIGQGTLTARAAEPAAGEADGKGDATVCLNCAAQLIGRHCHQCGQSAHVHKTLAAFFHDLLHGVFHFEGKIWRTLPMLAWHPGRLTREYIDGRRASYVSPIALFLFVVFLTFALFSLIGQGNEINLNDKLSDAAQARAQAELAAAHKDVARLRAEQAQDKAAGRTGYGKMGQLIGAEKALDAAQSEVERSRADNKLPDGVATASDPASQKMANLINQAWRKAKENPSLLAYKLETDAYKFSWLLIPLSVPFVWFLFPFSRRFHIYDHTVFVTYSISFMMILIAVLTFASFTKFIPLMALITLYAPFHMYRQLKETYSLSRFGALWRMSALMLFALVAMLLFIAVMLTMVMAG